MIYSYKEITPAIKRPIIEIIILTKNNYTIYPVLIDSGADYCIFSTELAKDLGVELSKSKISFRGIGKGKVMGRLAEIEMRISNHMYKTKVLFTEIGKFGHGILGQHGFFDHFDVKLSYQKQTIEIEPLKISN